MSTNTTANLGLHAWAGNDRVLRDEMNDNFAEIDASIYNLQTGNETNKSKISALQADNVQNITYSTAVLDGSTDDTAAVQSFFNGLSKKTVVMVNKSIKLSGTLTVPDGVNIIGYGATVFLSGRMILNGNNRISGITFDGQNATDFNPVKLMGDNITICNNTFKNFKTSSSNMETNVLMTWGNNIHIEDNTFDTIAADAIAKIARAIRTNNSDNVFIRRNLFKNMIGYDDSDYLYITSNSLDNTNFPFSSCTGTLANKVSDRKNVVIEDNDFLQSCKSSVKIQCSGVQVTNNRITITEATGSVQVWAAVRAYNSTDLHIDRNKIYLNALDIAQVITLEFCQHCTVDDNEISSVVGLSSNTFVYYYNYGVILNYVDDVSVSNNRQYLKNMTGLIHAFNAKRTNILNNQGTMETGGKATAYLIYLRGTSDILSDTVTIEGNTLYSDYSTQQINVELSTKVFVNNNNLLNVPSSFRVQQSTTVQFNKNKLGKSGVTISYLIELNLTCDDIQFIDNEFNSNCTYIMRIYSPCTKIKFWRNTVKGTFTADGLINITGNGSQVLSEIEYVPGIIKLDRYDKGSTSARGSLAAISLQVSHVWFDTTLNYPVFWSGSGWRNGAGAVV